MTRTTRWPTAVLAVLAMLPWSLQARDPLAGQFSIYRDEYGVPHIVGETEEATFFGYGYAQAQDHLEKMFIQYRDAQGRRAEVQILRFAQDDSGGGHNIHSLVRTWR